MKTLYKRFKGETPVFFKRVRNLCAMIAAASVTGYQYAYMLPPVVVQYLGYGATAGVVGAFISQFTVANPEDLKKS